MNWTVVEAKRKFSRILKMARVEPQWITSRGRLIAAVLAADEAREFLAWRERRATASPADRFRDLRELCARESYEFEVPARSDRSNPVASDVNRPIDH